MSERLAEITRRLAQDFYGDTAARDIEYLVGMADAHQARVNEAALAAAMTRVRQLEAELSEYEAAQQECMDACLARFRSRRRERE